MFCKIITIVFANVRVRGGTRGGRNILNMSTSSYSPTRDHMVVTKDKQRNHSIHSAVVIKLDDLSPTTKGLDLQVSKADNGQEFFFSPGQWLDVFIPGLDTIGGFSLTSTPKQFLQNGRISLAVKYSTWPPANWFHSDCRVGSEVKVRCGGDFVLPEEPNGDMVFLAGGVGINPIASMIFHLMETNYPNSVTLFYSAKCEGELLFKKQFDELLSVSPKFRVRYFVTGGTAPSTLISGAEEIFARRIMYDDISGYLTTEVVMYVCGPPSLIDMGKSMRQLCQDVKYEQWW